MTPDYYTGESEFRLVEFRRADQLGGLNAEETVTGTPAVTVRNSAGADMSSTMVADVAVYNQTAVRYRFLASATGTYVLVVSAPSSNGQTLKHRLTLTVEDP